MEEEGGVSEQDRVMYERMAREIAVRALLLLCVHPAAACHGSAPYAAW